MTFLYLAECIIYNDDKTISYIRCIFTFQQQFRIIEINGSFLIFRFFIVKIQEQHLHTCILMAIYQRNGVSLKKTLMFQGSDFFFVFNIPSVGDDLLDLLSNKLQPVSKFAFCIYIRTRVFPNVLESAGVLTPMPLNLTVLSLKVLTNNKCKYLNNIIFVMLDPAALF